MKKLILMLAFIMFLAGIAGVDNKASASTNTEYSTWLWDTNQIVTNRAATLQFLEEKQVSHVYLQINRSIKVDQYKQFIKEATSLGIKVYALDGAPEWGPSSKPFLNFLNWVTTYQADAAEDENFSGIHLDVEPYLTSQWTTNYNGAVLKYQGVILAASDTAKSLGIPFAADIPFWFDEMNVKNKYGKGNLAEWVITNTSEVTIMAYRDKAVGPNGIIELTKYELNLAASLNKDVTIAVETMNLGSSDGFLTFYEEGQNVMNQELTLVSEAYKEFSSFKGIAVHHVGSWMELE
ncbi:amidase [Metabacillus halosaccharovorans]|uniref:amidase n=1 Tax=Metabacillus halosaccharovorans TaxID=930124 RepID=UPI0037365175